MPEKERNGRNNSLSRGDFFRVMAALAGGALLTTTDAIPRADIWRRPLPEPGPDATRFLLIGDVHAAPFDSGMRQTNSKSTHALSEVLQHLDGYPFDRFFQLGDLITEQDSLHVNITNFSRCLDILGRFPVPAIHLLGNHDLWGIPKPELLNMFRSRGLNPEYGSAEFNRFQVVWLDMDAPPRTTGYLPEERIDWLKSVIYRDTPTFIFTHYPFLQQNPDGNPYFEGDRTRTAYTNGVEAWRALEGLPVHAVIGAHLHWGSHTREGTTDMMTVPAFVENIAAHDDNENPGIYSVLEITDPTTFTLKSYFGSTCFLQFQSQ